MNPQSYDYNNRQGINEITWEEFGEYTKKLSEALSRENIDIIVGIARAGLLPATAVACLLCKEMYPVSISRRLNDEVISKTPFWKVKLPKTVVKGKIVGVIDEIADTGQTLKIVRDELLKSGAKKVVTASLISHSWANPKPEYVILESDELILFPWSYQVYVKGAWKIHPEIREAFDKLKNT